MWQERVKVRETVKEEYSDKEQSEKALKGKRIWAEA